MCWQDAHQCIEFSIAKLIRSPQVHDGDVISLKCEQILRQVHSVCFLHVVKKVVVLSPCSYLKPFCKSISMTCYLFRKVNGHTATLQAKVSQTPTNKSSAVRKDWDLKSKSLTHVVKAWMRPSRTFACRCTDPWLSAATLPSFLAKNAKKTMRVFDLDPSIISCRTPLHTKCSPRC